MSRGVERFAEIKSHANPDIATGEVFACTEDGHDVCAYTTLERSDNSNRNIMREMLVGIVETKGPKALVDEQHLGDRPTKFR